MPSNQLNYTKSLNNTLSHLLIFYVAIYIRLSKSEEGKSSDEQSRSITNQKNICLNFLKSLIESDNGIIKYIFVDYYIDDGFSGSNFNRPAFTKLKQDIENHQINMVIIKDLSRLGREHIESDAYLEKWFPEHDTRCIAILDNIDTFSANSNLEIAPILNWANERHNKETSKKIKKTFKENIHAGLYMGSNPPYGLIKGTTPKTKHRLTIDEEVRPIIIDIFTKAKQEWSLNKIAQYLTNQHIPTPSIHKKSNRGVKSKTFNIWDPNTIKDILTNEMYIGHLVQGKTTKLSLKSKKITYVPKEDWVIIKNTHEAIIDQETFDLVQLILKKNTHQSFKSKSFLLKKLLICEECGHTLSIQQNKNSHQAYTVCNYYKKYSKYHVCTPHRFNYWTIEKTILNTIKNQCQKYVDNTNFINILKNIAEEQNQITKNNLIIKQAQNNIQKYKRQIITTYTDKLNNLIDESTFQNIQQDLKQKITNEELLINNTQKTINKLTTSPKNNYQQIIKQFLSLKDLNRTTILQIIDKITISQDQTINIYFKFKKP